MKVIDVKIVPFNQKMGRPDKYSFCSNKMILFIVYIMVPVEVRGQSGEVFSLSCVDSGNKLKDIYSGLMAMLVPAELSTQLTAPLNVFHHGFIGR